MRKNDYKNNIQTKTVETEDLTAYYNDLKRYKPLKREEERELLKLYKENDDLVARQKLITHNLRYAFSLVNKYKDRGVSISDLVEEANCGLIESIDEFNTDYDVKVITYARWKMEYKMQRAIEEKNKIQTDDLPEDYETQISDEALLTNEYSNDTYANNAFADEEINYSKQSANDDVAAIITILDEKERDFIQMYYGIKPYEKEYTYQEIGDKYGITKERVRQIIDKIMRKLRVQALTILE